MNAACGRIFAVIVLFAITDLHHTLQIVPTVQAASNQIAFGFVSSRFGQVAPRGFFPQTLRDAVLEGWTADTSSADSSNTNNMYVHADFPSYKILYGNWAWMPSNSSEISALVVTMDAVYDEAGTATPAPGGVLINADTGVNVTTNITNPDGDVAFDTDASEIKMEYRIQLNPGGGATVGDLVIPATYQEAEDQGWIETGCMENMGGAHYVPPDSLIVGAAVRYAMSPIYDKYTPDSGGVLSALQLGAGVPPQEEMLAAANGGEFDNSGWTDLDNFGMPVTKMLACGVHCGHPGCFNLPGNYARTGHIYLRPIKMNATTLQVENVQCQAGPEIQCHSGPCAVCCGPPAEEAVEDPNSWNPEQWCKISEDKEDPPGTAKDTISMGDCRAGISALNFELKNFERYNEYFREDSVLTLPPAGSYKGAGRLAFLRTTLILTRISRRHRCQRGYRGVCSIRFRHKPVS